LEELLEVLLVVESGEMLVVLSDMVLRVVVLQALLGAVSATV